MTFRELLLRNRECANLAARVARSLAQLRRTKRRMTDRYSNGPGASRGLSGNSAGEAQEDEPVEAATDAIV